MKEKKPLNAVLLNLVVAGAGYFYLDRPGWGLFGVAASIMCWMFQPLTYFTILFWSCIHCWWLASKHKDRQQKLLTHPCPMCAEPIQLAAKICPHCRSPVKLAKIIDPDSLRID